MKSIRILSSLGLAALLAFAISACQQNSKTEMSQISDSSQVTQGYTNEATPPPETGVQGATLPNTHKTTTTKKHKETRSSTSSSTPSTPSKYAEQRTIEIPAGTNFEVEMITPVDTRTSNEGDRVDATLAAPLTVNGQVVAETGAHVTGVVTDIQRASKKKSKDDRASIALDFNTIETIDGPKPLHATVANAEGKLIAKSTSTRDKLLIGGGAVAGAVIGKVAGGSTKSVIIGAVAGAAAGTGAVLVAKGHELEIPAGAKVALRVDKPIVIVER